MSVKPSTDTSIPWEVTLAVSDWCSSGFASAYQLRQVLSTYNFSQSQIANWLVSTLAGKHIDLFNVLLAHHDIHYLYPVDDIPNQATILHVIASLGPQVLPFFRRTLEHEHIDSIILLTMGNTQHTLLHLLAKSSSNDALALLIRTFPKICDYINNVDNLAQTALHYAVLSSNIPIAFLLLQNGASCKIQNKKGHSAFRIAQHRAQLDFIGLALVDECSHRSLSHLDVTKQLMLLLQHEFATHYPQIASYYNETFQQYENDLDGNDNDNDDATTNNDDDSVIHLAPPTHHDHTNLECGFSLFHFAAFFDCAHYFDSIDKTFLSSPSIYHHSSLSIAIKQDSRHVVDFIIQKQPKTLFESVEFQHPLHLAVLAHRFEIVQTLVTCYFKHFVRSDTPIEMLDYLRSTPSRANTDQLLRIKSFLEQPGQYNATPIFLAASIGDAQCLSFLLRHAVFSTSVNTCNSLQVTPLQVSVEHGHTECVRLLLNEPDILVNGLPRGKLPLYSAAISRDNLDILQLLLEHPNINPNAPCAGGTVLFAAVKHRKFDALRLLLRHRDIDINFSYAELGTVFHLAVRNDDAQCLSILLQDPNISLKFVQSVVSSFPHAMRCHQLVFPDSETTTTATTTTTTTASASTVASASAASDTPDETSLGRILMESLKTSKIPLIDATKLRSIKAVNFLLTQQQQQRSHHHHHDDSNDPNDDSFVNQTDEHGMTALHYACSNNDVDIVKSLLKVPDVFVFSLNSKNESAFYLAQTHNNQACIDLLQPFYDDIDHNFNSKAQQQATNQTSSRVTTDNTTAVAAAAAAAAAAGDDNGDDDDDDDNDHDSANDSDNSIPNNSLQSSDLLPPDESTRRVLEQCLAANVQCNAFNINQSTNAPYPPLLSAILLDNITLVITLLAHPDIDVNSRVSMSAQEQPASLAHFALFEDKFDIFNLIMQHPSLHVEQSLLFECVTKSNRFRRVPSPKYLTAVLKHSEIDVNAISPEYGNAALHSVIFFNLMPHLLILLDRPDLDINLTNKSANTPLTIAAFKGTLEAVKLLLSHSHIDVNCVDSLGYTPLHTSVKWHGHRLISAFLLHSAVDPNITNKYHNTVLHTAASLKDVQAVSLLVRFPNIVFFIENKHHKTPLDIALRSKCQPIITVLQHYQSLHD